MTSSTPNARDILATTDNRGTVASITPTGKMIDENGKQTELRKVLSETLRQEAKRIAASRTGDTKALVSALNTVGLHIWLNVDSGYRLSMKLTDGAIGVIDDISKGNGTDKKSTGKSADQPDPASVRKRTRHE